ncbi:MAG: D-cysteine desulfhydrase family protein [Clostridiales bacterium]|nr:D-cysteine desulfhydrase family protein [Clostridiales bacterium]
MKGLEKIKKIDLAYKPTPLYKLNNISLITGKNIFVKRDDMTGIGLGGNKVRKLEYLLADAIKCGADTIITTGAAQSNHAMLTAACCRKLGLDVILVLLKRGVTEKKGNLLLNDLMGVEVVFVDSDRTQDLYAEINRISDQLKAAGKTPYTIPIGASVPLGVLGYVDCVKEMIEQSRDQDIKIDHIVCCTGSGGTYAGLLLGAKLFKPEIKVTGIAVTLDDFYPVVKELVNQSCDLIKAGPISIEDDIHLFNYAGDGYAIPSERGNAAINLMARNEGLFLDPVYTGKTFGGLLDLIDDGYFEEDENIVFLHTGGAASIFAFM